MVNYAKECEVYINGYCNWSKSAENKSQCIYSPTAIFDGKHPDDCVIRKYVGVLRKNTKDLISKL
jgi:hypothetical protein